MSGKGSGARPFSVDSKTFADNFDAIFSKPKPAQAVSICGKCEGWGFVIGSEGSDLDCPKCAGTGRPNID